MNRPDKTPPHCDAGDRSEIDGSTDLAEMGEIEVLARTLYGEARGEPVAGKEAVANVVMNRVRRSREKTSGYWWGNDVKTVCTKPWQFSCWNANDPNRLKILTVKATDRNYQSCIRIARRAVHGALADRTGGATHFHARGIFPPWARGRMYSAEIGRHQFYSGIEQEQGTTADSSRHPSPCGQGLRLSVGKATRIEYEEPEMAEHIQIDDLSPRVQYDGDGAQSVFTYPFPIFEDSDLVVFEDTVVKVLSTDYTVQGAGQSAGGTVTFTVAPAANSSVTILRNVPIKRTSDFQESGEFRANVLNDELDKQIAMLQQVAEDVGRAVTFPATPPSTIDLTLPEPTANALIAWSSGADGLVNGPSTTEIDTSVTAAAASASAAASSATDASNSASTAATHETNAGNSAGAAATEAANAATSAGQAAASATQAANAAASNIYSTVENETFADSPIAVGANDNGTLFVIDTTGGAVVVNMPDIDTVGEAFRCGVLKDDGGSNTITVSGDDADTINGSANYVIANAREMANFVADEVGATDSWVAFGGGVSAGNRTTEIFVDSTDYTSGTTTQLTLANDYGAEDNIDVLFDGHGQHRNTYSLSGTALTFAAAIPLGTGEVQVTGGYTQPIAVPADNSVTTAKINPGAVTGVKLSDMVISDLTTETAIDGDNDFVMIHDGSANAKRKMSVTNLMADISAIIVGEVRMWPAGTAPTGFLICDGSEISRTTYADLFAVIGTLYGVGNGSTTFNLPDMRGRVVGGANDTGLPNGENGSFSTRNEANTVGAETHTLIINEMPSHSHTVPLAGGGSSRAHLRNVESKLTVF